MVRTRTGGTHSRKRVSFGTVLNSSCFDEPRRGGDDRRGAQRLKFWRMAANKRDRQPRENRKRKEEECWREKDLRQSRLVKSAKMLSILGSDHEGDVLLGAGQAEWSQWNRLKKSGC
jgi:hypothetical protein